MKKTRKGNLVGAPEPTPAEKLAEARKILGLASKAARDALRDPALIAELEERFPLGTIVEYIGGRVPGRTGQRGAVVGYRDGNGLYIDFPEGRGSITPGKASIISLPEAKKKTAKK